MNILWFIIAGLAAGVLAGMGMGGGTVMIPILTLLLHVEQHTAQAVNMLGFLPSALVAVLVHARAGRIQWQSAKPLLITGLIGAVGGALIATLFAGEWLRRGFGLFLVTLSVIEFCREEKRAGADHLK